MFFFFGGGLRGCIKREKPKGFGMADQWKILTTDLWMVCRRNHVKFIFYFCSRQLQKSIFEKASNSLMQRQRYCRMSKCQFVAGSFGRLFDETVSFERRWEGEGFCIQSLLLKARAADRYEESMAARPNPVEAIWLCDTKTQRENEAGRWNTHTHRYYMFSHMTKGSESYLSSPCVSKNETIQESVPCPGLGGLRRGYGLWGPPPPERTHPGSVRVLCCEGCQWIIMFSVEAIFWSLLNWVDCICVCVFLFFFNLLL